jgi:integrase
LHDKKVVNNTIAKYDSDFTRYFDGEDFCQRPIASITYAEVELFIFKKVEELNLCREALKTFLGYVKGPFAYAKTNKIISENVAKEIQRAEFYSKCTEIEHPKDVILVPDNDWIQLHERLQKNLSEKPYYFPPYAIMLAAFTGMRVGELSVLKWSDIQTDPISGCTYIGICRSETYDVTTKEYSIRDLKNHKTRAYPLSSPIHELLDLIEKRQMEAGIKNEWLFSDGHGSHIHKRPICDCLKNRCNQIGIRPKGIHAFRRQINSDMRCDGVSAVITSSLIGNSEAVNKKHYTFDVSSLEEKERIVELTNQKRLDISKK